METTFLSGGNFFGEGQFFSFSATDNGYEQLFLEKDFKVSDSLNFFRQPSKSVIHNCRKLKNMLILAFVLY